MATVPKSIPRCDAYVNADDPQAGWVTLLNKCPLVTDLKVTFGATWATAFNYARSFLAQLIGTYLSGNRVADPGDASAWDPDVFLDDPGGWDYRVATTPGSPGQPNLNHNATRAAFAAALAAKFLERRTTYQTNVGGTVRGYEAGFLDNIAEPWVYTRANVLDFLTQLAAPLNAAAMPLIVNLRADFATLDPAVAKQYAACGVGVTLEDDAFAAVTSAVAGNIRRCIQAFTSARQPVVIIPTSQDFDFWANFCEPFRTDLDSLFIARDPFVATPDLAHTISPAAKGRAPLGVPHPRRGRRG